MNDLDKKLNQIIKTSNKLIPKKINEGIQLGEIKIVQKNKRKKIIFKNKTLYDNIFLNDTALALAEYVFFKANAQKQQQLYGLDQEYGHWLIETKIFAKHHKEKLGQRKYYDAEIFESRYQEAKIRLDLTKQKIENLVKNSLNKRQLEILL